VDIGARSIDLVLFDGAQVVESSVTDTGAFPRQNALDAYEGLLGAAGVRAGDVDRTVATGYGRNYFEGADRVASEILCHAAGVAYLFPSVRTVIDIGGQDSKMISVGPEGKVLNFVMNDRCAAGTGKFIEIVAKTLSIPLEETGEAARKTDETCEISSMCAVFAESEIIGLLHKGQQREVILRGVFRSVARRTLGMAGKVGLERDIVFTGGVACNPGVLDALAQETGCPDILRPADPRITGALGAALIASRDLRSS
jgi:predicted CoA-substrate-specific enzyme activase